MARKIIAILIFVSSLVALSLAFILFVAPNSKTSESIDKIWNPHSVEKPFYTSIGGGVDMGQEQREALKRRQDKQSTYTIEFLLTSSRSEAEKIVEDLQKQKIMAYYMPVQKGGQIYYRVRSNLFSQESQAGVELRRLSQNLKINGKIVRL